MRILRLFLCSYMHVMMKGLVLHGVDQALQLETVPVPQLQPGEALVRVHAAAFNRRDWWIQRGLYAGLKFPIILGSDGAGVVAEVGDASKDGDWLGRSVIMNPSLGWEEDSEVQPPGFHILGLPENGTFAEYVRVPVRNLYAKPDYLSYEVAAAIPLGGLTAYRALFRKAQLKAGETVLITGVGGGVASFALQWAVHAGANVYVTSSSPVKIEKALAAGAKGGINYRQSDWADELKRLSGGFDVIIDSALGEGFAQLIDLAKPGGRIVFFGGTSGNLPPLDGRKIFWKQLQIKGTTMGSQVDFQEMLAFIQQHQIKPIIDRLIPWEQAESGLQVMSTQEQFGKIVLQMI